MKRLFVSVFLVAALLVSAAASASVDLNAMTDDELRALAINIQVELDNRAGSASTSIGAYSVSILDATLMQDDDGTECIVVTIEWSHTKEDAQTFFWSFNYYAYQDGIEISSPDAYIEMPLDTEDMRIKAGAVLQTQIAFALRNTESPVEIELSEYLGETDDSIQKTFDLLTLGSGSAETQNTESGGSKGGLTVIGKPRR